MGRGGPAEPELIERRRATVGVEELLARADAGQHAASDFLEDAALARVATVGARRCGGGLLSAARCVERGAGGGAGGGPRPTWCVLEGSGAAVPPVRRRPHDAGASRPPAARWVGFGPYRVLAGRSGGVDHVRSAVRVGR